MQTRRCISRDVGVCEHRSVTASRSEGSAQRLPPSRRRARNVRAGCPKGRTSVCRRVPHPHSRRRVSSPSRCETVRSVINVVGYAVSSGACSGRGLGFRWRGLVCHAAAFSDWCGSVPSTVAPLPSPRSSGPAVFRCRSSVPRRLSPWRSENGRQRRVRRHAHAWSGLLIRGCRSYFEHAATEYRQMALSLGSQPGGGKAFLRPIRRHPRR